MKPKEEDIRTQYYRRIDALQEKLRKHQKENWRPEFHSWSSKFHEADSDEKKRYYRNRDRLKKKIKEERKTLARLTRPKPFF